MKILVNEKGQLEMTEKRDDLNSYLTWGNVWKAVALIWAVIWFLTTQLKDNTVRDLKVDQITTDLKDIKGTIKDVQTDLKSNGTKSDDRLNILERNHELLKSELNQVKSQLRIK